MKTSLFGCALGAALCCGLPVSSALAAADSAPGATERSVASLAEIFKAGGVNPAGLESRLTGYCASADLIGNATEALLDAGYDVRTVVKSMILACAKNENGSEVAGDVISRVLLVKGPTVSPLIDQGVQDAVAQLGELGVAIYDSLLNLGLACGGLNCDEIGTGVDPGASASRQ